MGGAWLCSLISSLAYSGGSASGMVASSCATFMIGPFQPAKRRGELERVGSAIERHAEKARAGKARGGAAELGADFGVAARRGRRNGSFRGHGASAGSPASSNQFGLQNKAYPGYSSASSSSISLAITLRPPSQNFGSRASRPNGASSSE